MNFTKTNFDELYLIDDYSITDNRGSFNKPYNLNFFNQNNIFEYPQEFFYSISTKNVIRGMHFQIPPFDSYKIVSCINGEILDVVLDLRKSSKTFGKYYSVKLNNKQSIFIPKGFAHGFLSLEENTIVTYLQSKIYNKETDKGIYFNSFGFDWNIINPIINTRDEQLIEFKSFISPF